ncbi:Yip1 domain protein [Dictyocaulus viviparus]|uniref:Yip1 domain protein n=1 Tax=Dictyocaulus viviparus TaxID=29172 RepID=A0A0D8XVB5_DICVI|nr:Yip1 domain protein [Dictyocaulus viviparus]
MGTRHEDGSSSEKESRSRRILKEGEWACPDPKCAHDCVFKLLIYRYLFKEKPRSKSRVGKEIGKELADKSKGLFAAEDWVCSKCGNVNWARRKTCNVCNAPKLADLEKRTGYGGGFNDRQDIEYIKRDNDDEFDEFGRKRKKKEGEESDDTDEADLEKYDLTTDPELADIKIEVKRPPPRPLNIESDCSCSCSGGKCSCEDSEGDKKEMDKGTDHARDRVHKTSRQRDMERADRERRRRRSRSREKEDDKRDRVRDRERYRDSERRSSRSRERERTKERRRSRLVQLTYLYFIQLFFNLRSRGQKRSRSRSREKNRDWKRWVSVRANHGIADNNWNVFKSKTSTVTNYVIFYKFAFPVSTSAFEDGFSIKSGSAQNYPGSISSQNLHVKDNDNVSTTGRKSSFFSLGFYQQFFDVETDQVVLRILNSIVPTNNNYILDFVHPVPDFWGPFWISVTLVFSISIFGNIAQYIENDGEIGEYGSDFRLVTSSASLIFIYAVLVPVLLSTILWQRKSELQYSLSDLLCAYGYSLSVFVPVSILWTLDINWFRWTLIFTAVSLSGVVLVKSLWPAFKSDPNKLVPHPHNAQEAPVKDIGASDNHSNSQVLLTDRVENLIFSTKLKEVGTDYTNGHSVSKTHLNKLNDRSGDDDYGKPVKHGQRTVLPVSVAHGSSTT